MFNTEENIKVPENIDDYVKRGISLGVKKKKANQRKLVVNAAVICVLTIFTVSVRISPAFAAYIVKVPGMEYLVRFINYDKGLQSAVENNFFENINSSVTNEGIKFTIKDVIIDNSQALIFYSIENEKDNRNIELARVFLKNGSGEELSTGIGWGADRPYKANGNNKVEDRIDINFLNEDVLPEKLCIEIKLRDADSIDHTKLAESEKKSIIASSWNFEINIDREKIKAMEKTYVLNEMVEIEGQKITFKEVKITPTRVAVEVEYNENNSKKVFGYDDITIVNEKGETWGKIMNGVSGSKKDENHEILYFQSNYFNNPKHLYIKGFNLRALDKDKLDIVIDLENNKLLKSPNNKIKLMEIVKKEEETSIRFRLEKDKVLDYKYSYFIFNNNYKDSKGNTYHTNRNEMWESGLEETFMNFVIENNPQIIGPVFLEISNYPERISKDFEVRVK